VNTPAGPEPPAAARSFAIGFEAHRVVDDNQGSEVVHGSLQAARHCPTVEGHGDPFGPVIGTDP